MFLEKQLAQVTRNKRNVVILDHAKKRIRDERHIDNASLDLAATAQIASETSGLAHEHQCITQFTDREINMD